MEKNQNFHIDTDLTLLQIYPHAKSLFHYLMAIITILFFIPLIFIALPILILLKFIIYSIFYSIFFIILRSKTIISNSIFNSKNYILLYFHYYIYKVLYIYMTLWIICFGSYDDYWYGLDISNYKDYNDFKTSFRNSKVRWKLKKKIKLYNSCNIEKQIVSDYNVFFKVLFSYKIFKLICTVNFRKNAKYTFLSAIFVIIRDYYLLLFLPVRLHIFKQGDQIVGLASYLKRGNTLMMCQHIISNEFRRIGMYYEQMNDCMNYAFNNNEIHYVSCAVTTGQAKQTCGCYPINYLLTDEFKFIPFSRID